MKNIYIFISLAFIIIIALYFLPKNESNDPLVGFTLTERQGKYRLETKISTDGNMSRGYYQEESDVYQNEIKSKIPDLINKKLWAALNSEKINRKFMSSDPKGDFKTIGVYWQSGSSGYGVSYNYTELAKDSPLWKALQIVQENNLDKWEIPK